MRTGDHDQGPPQTPVRGYPVRGRLALYLPTATLVVLGILGSTRVVSYQVQIGLTLAIIGYVTGGFVADGRWHRAYMRYTQAQLQANVDHLGEVLAHADPDDMPDGLHDAMTAAYRNGKEIIASEAAPKRRFGR